MAETVDAQNSGTETVPERLAIDVGAVAQFCAEKIPDFKGPLEVRKFKGGQSNPTYLLKTPTRAFVLRRKPPGKLLPSAHAVDREFRVLSALHGQGFPVPKPHFYHEDEGPAGTPFFVMDFLEGRIFWDGTLPSQSPQGRTSLYLALIDTLASLHTVNVEAAGLSDYGKHGDYFGRQIRRWSRQYKDSETDPIPAMDELIDWLPKNLPDDDQTTIVHGDFRIDNVIFHSRDNRVIGVLDWELSTLGHPIADLSYFLMTWHFPPAVRSGLAGCDLAALGIPAAEALVERYCTRTGRTQMPDINFCLAYNMFRMAAIIQGVVRRALDGNASSAQALSFRDQVPTLAALALERARMGAT